MYSISLCVERNDQDNSIETDIEISNLANKAVVTNYVNGFKNQIDSILRKRDGFYISQHRFPDPIV